MFLRQSTSQIIRFGPHLDSTDGVTAETALTIAQADMQLSKDGAAFAQKSAAGNATHDTDGWYSTTLSTTDTATVGELILQVVVAGSLPVWTRYWVIEEAIYDALYGAAAAGFNASGLVTLAAVTHTGAVVPTVTTLTGHTAQTGDNFARLGAPAGASVSADVAAVKGDTAAILVDTAEIGAAGAGLTDITINAASVDLIWDEVLTGGTHNVVNSAGRRLRQIQEAGGYSGGFIYIDTVNGTAGTTNFENGVDSNPVDSIADANTLAASLGVSQFRVAPGSTITFAATQANQVFKGEEWTLALGGQNIAGTLIEGATVSGTGTGANSHFMRCEIATVTFAATRMGFCRFTGTITLSAASDYYWHDCYSGVAGGGAPIVDFGAAVANTNLSMRRYSGGIQIDNKDATGTDQMSLEGDGQLIVSASSGGAISVRGNFKVTNTGGATITYDDNTQGLLDMQGATFATGTDSLEAIRNRGDAAWTTGAGGSPPHLMQSTTIATLASQTSFTLTAGSSDDDAYNGAIAVVTDSATAEQKAYATVSDYTGSTKTVTLSADPAIFTMAVGDTIDIMSPLGAAGSAPTVAQIADGVWDEAQSGHTGAGTFGEIATETAAILVDTADMQPKLGTPAADVSADIAAVKVDTAATLVDTAQIGVAGAGLTDLGGMSTAMKAEVNAEADTAITDAALATAANLATVDTNVDAVLVDTATTIPAQITALNDISVADILTTQMTEAYAADGVAPTLAQAIFAIMQQAGEFSIAGTTITVKRLDGTTTAMTFTLDDGTDPTSRTRAT